MPYVRGKLKGELTAPELRRMIKLHNKMVGITIPTGSKRDDLIKIIESNGFKIDHAKQKLIPTSQKMIRKKNVPLPPPAKRKAKTKKSEPSIDDEIHKLMKSSDKLDKKSKPKTKKPNIDDEIDKLMKISDELEAKKDKKKTKKVYYDKEGKVLDPVTRDMSKKPADDEEQWKVYLNMLKEHEVNLKKMLRSKDAGGKYDNQYDFYMDKYKKRNENNVTAKRMIGLLRKISFIK